jgi:hypothetical protein
MKQKQDNNTEQGHRANMVLAPSGQELSVTDLRILIRELKEGIKYCKKQKEMDRKSWGYETGILITGNDAVMLLQLCQTAVVQKRSVGKAGD